MICVILNRVVNSEQRYNIVTRDHGGQMHVISLDWWWVTSESVWTLTVFQHGTYGGAGKLTTMRLMNFEDLAKQVRDETDGQLNIAPKISDFA